MRSGSPPLRGPTLPVWWLGGHRAILTWTPGSCGYTARLLDAPGTEARGASRTDALRSLLATIGGVDQRPESSGGSRSRVETVAARIASSLHGTDR